MVTSLFCVCIAIYSLPLEKNAEFPEEAEAEWRSKKISILEGEKISNDSFSAMVNTKDEIQIVRDGEEENISRENNEFIAKLDRSLLFSVTDRMYETRHIFKDGMKHTLRRKKSSEQWLLIDQDTYDAAAGPNAAQNDPYWERATSAHNQLLALWLDNGRPPDVAAKNLKSYDLEVSNDQLVVHTDPGNFKSNPGLGAHWVYLPSEKYRLDSYETWYVHNGVEETRFLTKFSDVSDDYLRYTITEQGGGQDDGALVKSNSIVTVAITPEAPDPDIFDLAHYNIIIREKVDNGSSPALFVLIGIGVLLVGLSVWLKRRPQSD